MSQELAQIQYWLDRISKLEKQVDHYKNKAKYLDKRELELLSEINSLEKDLHMIQRHYDQLEMFSPSGNNAQDVGNTNINLPNGREMNAYEIADELRKHGLNGDNHGLFNKRIQNMLRQQANELDKVVPQLVKANGLIENLRLRIAELEETINACYTVQKMQAEEVYKGNDRIAELEKLLEHSVGSDCREMRYIQELENKDARIAELEKDLKKYDQLAWDDLNKSKTIWCACGDGITPDSGAKCGICASTTPQTNDGCGNCHACLVGVMENGYPVTMQRMIVCPDCGNKRCPKASNHRHQCTGSNEPNQRGSIYTTPQTKPLSDEEIIKIFNKIWVAGGNTNGVMHRFARAIEERHGIK